MNKTEVAAKEEKLVRAVGLFGVIALTINGIIGAGIFALPASMAEGLGVSSPIAFLFAGLFASFIVLCFAELGGRYEQTGGAYLYAVEAFGGGPLAFVIGWMYLLARITSSAALANAMVDFIGYFQPIQSPIRELFLFAMLTTLGILNYIGIRFSSRLINFLTAAKLLPLLIFIGVGIFFVSSDTLARMQMPPLRPLSEMMLLAMFAFSGFEVIAVPGAEIIHPRRTLPLGLLIGTGITILIYISIQLVAVATHPGLAGSKRPLAEAADLFLGNRGGILLTAGAVFSTFGTLTSLFLVGPRILYAMALNKQMPFFLSVVHANRRVPHVAIFFFTAVTTAVTLSGTFRTLATLSAMARLVTYIGAALALLVLRKRQPATENFIAPGGHTIPILTILLSLLLLTAATTEQWRTGSIALGAGFVLYFLAARRKTE